MLNIDVGEIPSCFKNLIGIRGVCASPDGTPLSGPRSGLYINDLQLITVKTAAYLANGEDFSGIALLERMIELATRKMLGEISEKMMPHFAFETVQDYGQPGEFSNCFEHYSNIMRGVSITRCDKDTKSTIIQAVDVLVDAYRPVDPCINEKLIQIVDGIYTTNYYFTPISGEVVRVEMDYIMKSDTVYIIMNNVDVSVNHGSIDKNFQLGCSKCGGLFKNKHNVKVRGYNGYGNTNLSASLCGSYSTPPKASFDNCIYGLLPVLRTECDYSKILCAISKEMAWLLMYKTASEFILYWMASDRVNEKTIGMTVEELDRWRMLYEDNYKARYKSMSNVLQTLLCKYAGDCIRIKGHQYKYSL